ncbi:hypothetical protein OROHE_025635 [Orobanche hederae]
MQACFALTLQAATMAAQVVREVEGRPSISRLQADLEAARHKNAEFADKLMVMEKNSLDAAKKARQEAEQARVATERLRAEAIEARKSLDAAMKEATERIVTANHRAEAAEGKAGQGVLNELFLFYRNNLVFLYANLQISSKNPSEVCTTMAALHLKNLYLHLL